MGPSEDSKGVVAMAHGLMAKRPNQMKWKEVAINIHTLLHVVSGMWIWTPAESIGSKL